MRVTIAHHALGPVQQTLVLLDQAYSSATKSSRTLCFQELAKFRISSGAFPPVDGGYVSPFQECLLQPGFNQEC